ncbi:hypothetical protein I601_1888 [Nocardioides dokdonensis FR1436]|uniref:DUF559 domain-containing protein n=1 Tax=Nocardioides dokdonensis FR1436 TaxID=1300347 RepID=A0A1A9GJ83_9ACTN|nr:DUF559 domain-containing protein [Nocardioides dokdonensis]ANH38318.1 hypothetical protein I601_1888 [Nocardioides dokdonensis FR1436]
MDDDLPVAEVLTALGGVATREALVRACSRRAVDAALAAGDVVALARGRYALPAADEARRAAHRVSGVVSHRSAALLHGWAVSRQPDQPEVTVPRNRNVTGVHRDGIALRLADLHPSEVVEGRTSPERTLVDCLRVLPFSEALAVADSALREGFGEDRLQTLARDVRGPGARQVRRVAACAERAAANPFESVLRAICLGVEGLSVRAQVSVRDPDWLGRPDLVDERLKIALEADSFEWHGDRAALHRDARRYNAFVAAGWLVLRFSWEEVMLHPERVAAVPRAQSLLRGSVEE